MTRGRFRIFYPQPGRAASLVRAVAGSAGLRVVGMGMGFLVGVQLARGLSPPGYGIYGIAMSAISMLMIPTEFGLPQLVTREVAAAGASEDPSVRVRVFGWSRRLVVYSSVGLAVLSAIALYFVEPGKNQDLRSAWLWGLLLLPVIATSNIASAALRGLHRIVEGQVAELVLRPASYSLLLLACVVGFGGTSLTPAVAMALNVVAAGLGACFALWRLGPEFRRAPPEPLLGPTGRDWLGSALPLAMGDGMRIVSGNLAVVVLGALATNSEVGIYRVALGVYTVATLPSALLNAACSPMLSTLHQEGRKDAIQRLNAWMALFLVCSACACLLPFLLDGKPLISLLFGRAYADANSILLVLLIGELCAGMLGHPTIVLNMLRRERVIVWCSAMALALSAVLCLLLVPRFGGIGAATAVAVSQIAWRFAASLYARLRLGLDTTLLAWVFRRPLH